MIYIKKEEKNIVLLRLFDKQINCDSFFIIKIYRTGTNTNEPIINLLSPDISTSSKYSLFEIEHSVNGIKNGDVIEQPIYLESGQWTYEILETSEYSLDMNKVIGTIEKDILFVELPRTVNTDNNKWSDVYY